MSLIAILTPLAGLTYYLAIVLPRSETRAIRILALSCIVGIALSAVLAVIVTLNSGLGATLNLEHEGLVHLFAPCLAAMGIMLALQQWQTRERHFLRLSLAGLVQTLSANLPRAVLGLHNPSSLALVVTYVVSIGAQMLILIPWRRAKAASSDCSTSIRKLWLTACHYRRYPMFRAPQDWLSATSQGLPVLMLGFFYAPTEAGLYVLARSIIGAPLDLIGNAVGGALYPRYAEARNDGISIAQAIWQHTIALAMLGILPFALITPFLPWMFSFLFGNQWGGAGQYAMLLGVWLFSNLTSVPSVRAVPVLAAEKLHLALGIMTMFGRAAALALTAVLGGSGLMAVALFCAVGVIANVFVILAIYRRARRLEIAPAFERSRRSFGPRKTKKG